MNNHYLITRFSAFALLAIVSLVILFEETTTTANVIGVPRFNPQLSERQLGREPCKYVEANIDVTNKDCERFGTLQCAKAYNLKPNKYGDIYTYPYNCLNQCLRDVSAQCEHASSAFEHEGER